MRGWCTGGASISTYAENVLLHSLRVLPLLMLLRVLVLLQLLLMEKRKGDDGLRRFVEAHLAGVGKAIAKTRSSRRKALQRDSKVKSPELSQF